MFAQVVMSGKVIIGRDALVNHVENNEFETGKLVNLELRTETPIKTHGTTVETASGYGVLTKDYGVIEIYSTSYNNLTIHSFRGMRYAM